ncbi:MAG TPA: arylmalonate decarboxylase [Sphingomonadaceae bacterium]|nr:arylmalonate decarboxylase [Sphingomonadaceae bacterium]
MNEAAIAAGAPSFAQPVIPLGWRLRLGVLMPSVNTVSEPTLAAMLPPGVSLHCTRLKLVGSTDEEILGMMDGVEDASRLLADCKPDRILFHCTAVTTFEEGIDGRIRDRITGATGIAASVTSEALVAAFRALNARRVVMVTPYIDAVNRREIAFLAAHGIEVIASHGAGLPGGEAFATVEPAVWYRRTMELRDPAADAYFVSCAQTRTGEIIAALEHDLGKPVVTSNTAAFWYCLRQSGLGDVVPGFGRLFRC